MQCPNDLPYKFYSHKYIPPGILSFMLDAKEMDCSLSVFTFSLNCSKTDSPGSSLVSPVVSNITHVADGVNPL